MSRIGTHRVLVSRPAVVATTTAAWYLVAGKTCVAAYQPKGAASLALSYTNLANPGTYDAAPGTAPTFNTATGWTFDGSTQYLTTGIVPASGYSMFVQYQGVTGGGQDRDFGYHLVGARFRLGYTETGFLLYASGGFEYVTPDMSSGNQGVAGQAGYRNGVSEATISGWTTTATGDIWIGRVNNLTRWWYGSIQALVIYSDTLTAGEVATVSAAMAAL